MPDKPATSWWRKALIEPAQIASRIIGIADDSKRARQATEEAEPKQQHGQNDELTTHMVKSRESMDLEPIVPPAEHQLYALSQQQPRSSIDVHNEQLPNGVSHVSEENQEIQHVMNKGAQHGAFAATEQRDTQSSGQNELNHNSRPTFLNTAIHNAQLLQKERANLSYCLLQYYEQVKIVRQERNTLADAVAKLQQEFQKSELTSTSYNERRINGLIELVQVANTKVAESEDYLDTIESAVKTAERDLKAIEHRNMNHLIPDAANEGPDLLADVLDLDILLRSEPSEPPSYLIMGSHSPSIPPSRMPYDNAQIRQNSLPELLDLDQLLPTKNHVPSEGSIEEQVASFDNVAEPLPQPETPMSYLDRKIAVRYSGIQFASVEEWSSNKVPAVDIRPLKILPSESLLAASEYQERKRFSDLNTIMSYVATTMDNVSMLNVNLPIFEEIDLSRFTVDRSSFVNGILRLSFNKSWLEFSRLVRYIEYYAELQGQSLRFLKKLNLEQIDAEIRKAVTTAPASFMEGITHSMKVGVRSTQKQQSLAQRKAQHKNSRDRKILVTNTTNTNLTMGSRKQV